MIHTLIPTLAPIIRDVLGAVLPNKQQAIKAEQKLLDALRQVDRYQVDINKVEATHSSIFVAGWRPAIGWICGMGLGWSCIVQPLLSWLSVALDWQRPLPVIPADYLVELILAMLGLGGLRSFEKIKGVARR